MRAARGLGGVEKMRTVEGGGMGREGGGMKCRKGEWVSGSWEEGRGRSRCGAEWRGRGEDTGRQKRVQADKAGSL